MLLVGSCAVVVVIDLCIGGVLVLVFMFSYDLNLFVDGIFSKDYFVLLNDLNILLVNCVI